jgi:hypothetical protein
MAALHGNRFLTENRLFLTWESGKIVLPDHEISHREALGGQAQR